MSKVIWKIGSRLLISWWKGCFLEGASSNQNRKINFPVFGFKQLVYRYHVVSYGRDLMTVLSSILCYSTRSRFCYTFQHSPHPVRLEMSTIDGRTHILIFHLYVLFSVTECFAVAIDNSIFYEIVIKNFADK